MCLYAPFLRRNDWTKKAKIGILAGKKKKKKKMHEMQKNIL